MGARGFLWPKREDLLPLPIERDVQPTMSEKDASREPSVTPASLSEESVAKTAHAAEDAQRKPADQFHSRQVELYKQSLAAEGEVAYLRWGLPFFHSMSDEEVETQQLALGLEPTDALDFYNKGCLLAIKEDFAGAAKAFGRAVQLQPELAEARYNQALALESAGNKAAARDAWQAYLEKFGESEDAEEVKQHLGTLAEA
jgi:tetratricopeptide (TPR) repeat protein